MKTTAAAFLWPAHATNFKCRFRGEAIFIIDKNPFCLQTIVFLAQSAFPWTYMHTDLR